MNYHQLEIVLQEVPGEISLCFSITGCSLRCNDCHSPFLWKQENGELLSTKTFIDFLKMYKNYATCVLFMGGEWHQKELIYFLQLAKENNYKTCLYTGETKVSSAILKELNWIKTGKWDSEKGGLDNPSTNQQFIDVKTNTILNHLFIKSHHYDTIN